MAKLFANNAGTYEETERISLVSSFVTSLLLGRYAPLDFGDASGMNLLDIHARRWSPECLQAMALPNLAEKLGGEPVHAASRLGRVSEFLQRRFGLNSECIISAFTGDVVGKCYFWLRIIRKRQGQVADQPPPPLRGFG